MTAAGSSDEDAVVGRRAVRLRWHVIGLIAVLLVVWSALDLDGVFISDEGSYGIQVRSLVEGSWDIDYAFAAADPVGQYVPYHGSTFVDGKVVPYGSHPLWPRLQLSAVQALGEPAGLRIIGVGSVVALSVVAWALAGELGRANGKPWAFWLAAASHVLANAWMLWAHASSAAVGGLLVLSVIRGQRRWPWLLVAMVASGVGVQLRSEGLVWAAAVAMAFLVLWAGRRAAAAGAAALVGAVGGWVLERRWTTDILSGTDGVSGGTGVPEATPQARGGSVGVLDRVQGTRIALIDGAMASQVGRLLGLVVIALVLVAVWQVVGRRATSEASLLLGVAGAALLVRVLLAPDDPAPGLLVAAPTLMLAVLWRPRERREVAVALSILLFVGAIAVSIYPDGGSIQWGARFLSPLLGVAAAAAGAGITGGRLGSPRARRPVLIAVGLLACAQAVGAVVVPENLRRSAEEGVAAIDDLDVSVVIAQGGQTARLDWRAWPDRCWIAMPEESGVDGARAVLAVLADSGVERAGYAGVPAEWLRRAGATVVPSSTGRPIGIVTLDTPRPGAGADGLACRG